MIRSKAKMGLILITMTMASMTASADETFKGQLVQFGSGYELISVDGSGKTLIYDLVVIRSCVQFIMASRLKESAGHHVVISGDGLQVENGSYDEDGMLHQGLQFVFADIEITDSAR